MNKTLKYILIAIAVFFAAMFLVMFFMRSSWTSEMATQEENMQNIEKQASVQSVNTSVEYKDISTKELSEMIKNKDFTLVNVHIPYIGDIEGTDASIPFNEIASNLDKLPKDKNAKIVLYCQSGNMSAIAADTLAQLGYTNVYNMKGGMIQWQKDGNKLVQK